MKNNESFKVSKKEVWYWVVMLPALFFVMIGMYMGMSKISEKNSKVCTFMGKIWISIAQETQAKPEGCYTYNEIAEIDFYERNPEYK